MPNFFTRRILFPAGRQKDTNLLKLIPLFPLVGHQSPLGAREKSFLAAAAAHEREDHKGGSLARSNPLKVDEKKVVPFVGTNFLFPFLSG